MWGTQVSGIPSLERKVGGQRHHLLQAAAKEIWYQQKNANGGGTRLQVPISWQGINKSTICADQAVGGRGGSKYKQDSCDKRPHHNISPYGTNTKSRSFQDHQLLPKSKYTSEKLSVDTLVKLSKGNIDALLSAK